MERGTRERDQFDQSRYVTMACTWCPPTASRSLGIDASTWTVESPSGSAILRKLPVKGRPATTFVGNFSMPFQLTLRLN